MSATTGNKVFAPAIFFIAFREALEAALVIGILSGMLERILDVRNQGGVNDKQGRALIRKLRKYIWLGALSGLLLAFAIGAAFLAVFYTQTTDLYGKAEELWEGIFCLIAVVLITPMSLAILRADRSRAKWRKKLSKAFEGLQTEKETLVAVLPHGHSSHHAASPSASEGKAPSSSSNNEGHKDAAGAATASSPSSEREATELHELEHSRATQAQVEKQGKLRSIWTLFTRPFSGENRSATAIFFIPFVTTLREGLEGVVFIGGVSLGLPATSIPLPAIVGIFAGFLCGFVVFKAGSFSKVRIFLIFSTAFLLVIAAGMFSRSVYYLQFYQYVRKVGDAAAESGSGAGSYDALNYVWHLDCCNPEDKTNGGSGYAILNSLVGWNNTANVGSILSYIFYWLAVIAYLVWENVHDKRQKKKSLNARRASPPPSSSSPIQATSSIDKREE